jgi:hypothetical protein
MMWGMKVRQNGDWDHKPKLRDRFFSPTTNGHVWFTYDKTEYYTTSGPTFTMGTSERLRVSTKTSYGMGPVSSRLVPICYAVGGRDRSDGVQGLKAFDDPSDRVSISMRIEFYRLVPAHVTPAHLVATILMTAGLDVRAASSSGGR